MGHVVGMGNLVTSGSVILVTLGPCPPYPPRGGGWSRASGRPVQGGLEDTTDVRFHGRNESVADLVRMLPHPRHVGSVPEVERGFEWHRGDAPILQARLFEEHGRPLGLDETVADASCFKVDVHRATYPQELTTTVEVSNPPLQRAPRHGCTSLTGV